jgi:hypothetical protein
VLGPLAGAYENVVAPIVERTISDLDERTEVTSALRAMSIKMGVAMLSYARMAGCEQPLEVAVLAGAVTRLYDDLIDGNADPSLDCRLADLFGAGLFVPLSDLEQLLADLVGEIRQRVRPQPGDAVDTALSALHEFQCLSRRQRENAVPITVLEKICCGKGAMAHLILCSLVKPELGVAEREMLMALGETFQSLDDYMDVEQDRRNGVATLASLGVTTLTDIGERMCVHRSRLVAGYGRNAARPYCGMIFFLLLKAATGRRLPILGHITGRLARRSATAAFLIRGTEALPASPGDGRES